MPRRVKPPSILRVSWHVHACRPVASSSNCTTPAERVRSDCLAWRSSACRPPCVTALLAESRLTARLSSDQLSRPFILAHINITMYSLSPATCKVIGLLTSSQSSIKTCSLFKTACPCREQTGGSLAEAEERLHGVGMDHGVWLLSEHKGALQQALNVMRCLHKTNGHRLQKQLLQMTTVPAGPCTSQDCPVHWHVAHIVRQYFLSSREALQPSRALPSCAWLMHL